MRTPAQRLIALLCIAAVLLLAFTAPGSAILADPFAPLWIFLFLALTLIPRVADPSIITRRPHTVTLVSRPPPIA